MSRAHDLWLWQNLQRMLGQPQILTSGDLQVQRGAGNHSYLVSEAFDQLRVIGRWLLAPICVGVQQQLPPEYLGRLGLPQLLAGDRLLDCLVLFDTFQRCRDRDGKNGGSRFHRSLEYPIDPLVHQTRPSRIVNGNVIGRVAAGLHASHVPSTPGRVRVQVKRGDGAFIDFTTPEAITDRPYRTDRFTYAYSSEFGRIFSGLFGDAAPFTSCEYGKPR